jgi:hypothetical protein
VQNTKIYHLVEKSSEKNASGFIVWKPLLENLIIQRLSGKGSADFGIELLRTI